MSLFLITDLNQGKLRNFIQFLILVAGCILLSNAYNRYKGKTAISVLKKYDDVDGRISQIKQFEKEGLFKGLDFLETSEYILFCSFIEKNDFKNAKYYLDELIFLFEIKKPIDERLFRYIDVNYKETKKHKLINFLLSDEDTSHTHRVLMALQKRFENDANIYNAQCLFYTRAGYLNRSSLAISKFDMLITKYVGLPFYEYQEFIMLFDIRCVEFYLLEKNYYFAQSRISIMRRNEKLAEKYALEILAFEGYIDILNLNISSGNQKLDYVMAFSKNPLTITYAKSLKERRVEP